jgi:hypothetical protein
VELRNTTKRITKKSMPKTFCKTIKEKQNFLTQNPTSLFPVIVLSRFSAFLCMAIPKKIYIYLVLSIYRKYLINLKKNAPTYVAWCVPVPVQVLVPGYHKNFAPAARSAQGF